MAVSSLCDVCNIFLLLRLTGETEANQLDSLSWQRVIVVLEILQNKKKLREPQILLPICFKLLSR
uniref:Uncharacterized protein n=1 Tax=Octopus bimaculoides TaxID=37653 RepID=A0A0L8GIP1_OCTBM